MHIEIKQLKKVKNIRIGKKQEKGWGGKKGRGGEWERKK